MSPRSHAEHDLAPLRDLLVSDDVNEVVVNPDQSIWVEYASQPHMERVDLEFTPQQIRTLGAHLASETRNALGKDHPIVSGRIMVFGKSMRVQIVVEPAVEAGVSLSIRKYVNRTLGLSEIRFLHGEQRSVDDERDQRFRDLMGMAEAGQLEDVLRGAVQDKLNILVSGGTSSGKTTVAQAMLAESDHAERIITIEDAPELMLPHKNVVTLIAERIEGSARAPGRLLESCLRMRPDRLILGEIRGGEALDFLEAINTGHPGSITTIHSNSPMLALERMALMVMRTGIRQTKQDVVEYACQTIDMIVQVDRAGGARGVVEIVFPRLMHDSP